ncbi:MAG: CDP-glucose 4,6-dehydratase [Acidobacteriaceae bacterium]
MVIRIDSTVSTSFSWKGRRVFVTGHTGFKGGWLTLWLTQLGATVRGYSLDPATEPNLFTVARIGSVVDDIRGDIRNTTTLERALQDFAPELVFHLAAQPLVRYSYDFPIETFETNVVGTAKVLDAIRRTPSVRAVVSVTTDKCYENKEWLWPYRESDPLGGYDPYSSSKACAEIVSAAFRQSYFTAHAVGASKGRNVAIATARAGNVIGGGDWSTDRLLPDLVQGFLSGQPVPIRHPHAIRPWQHVLEPLRGYILLAEKLLAPDAQQAARFATAYNFGPADTDARPVSWIAEQMTALWGNGSSWALDSAPTPHEAGYLKLDSSRAHAELGWHPQLNLQLALELLVGWYRAWQSGADMHALSLNQIEQYRGLPES